MKIFTGFLLLFLSNIAGAAQFTVNDITKGPGVYFSPGVNVIYGFCNYNWGGQNVYSFDEFMQGATSYSMDKNYLGRCVNVEVDIIGGRVVVPYVNQEAFAAALEKPELNVSRVRTASTATSGNPFTVKESEVSNYRGWSLVSAGIRGTTTYFSCYVETASLTFNWMEQAGFLSKELTPGYVYEITWFNRHIGGRDSKSCAGINVSLSPALLIAPPKPDPVPAPLQCNPGCVPSP